VQGLLITSVLVPHHDYFNRDSGSHHPGMSRHSEHKKQKRAKKPFVRKK